MADLDSTPFSAAPNLTTNIATRIQALGIADLEHLLAIANIPSVSGYLAEALGVTSSELASQLAGIAPGPSQLTASADLILTLGVLEPTDEIKQMSFETASVPPVSLPTSVNLIPQFAAVRQQGARGTCVAFAVVAQRELLAKKAGTAQDYSEQFLYHRTKMIDGSPGACGTWQVKAVTVIKNVGVCRESVWPYNASLPCNNNGTEPPGAAADAAKHKADYSILAPGNLQGLKAVLASGLAAGISIPVYASWYNSNAVRLSGEINMPLAKEPHIGGHALAVVGYKDDASYPGGGHIVLRNSWGTGWAANSSYGAGYGTLPYAYVTGHSWELVHLK